MRRAIKRGKAQYWTGTFLSEQLQLAAPLSCFLSRWGGRFMLGKWRNRRWCRRLGGVPIVAVVKARTTALKKAQAAARAKRERRPDCVVVYDGAGDVCDPRFV